MKKEYIIGFFVGLIIGAYIFKFNKSDELSDKVNIDAEENNASVKLETQNEKSNQANEDSNRLIKISECVTLAEEVKILPPPTYQDDLPAKLETNFQGEVRVAWNPVSRASKYIISLRDDRGNTIKTYKTSHNVIYLKEIPVKANLDFAIYDVSVATINKKNEVGIDGEIRKLVARPLENIMAPTIKSITIED